VRRAEEDLAKADSVDVNSPLPPPESAVHYWLSHSNRIPGWLTDSEACQLYTLARDILPERTPIAVELGSWQGKSSVMIAGGLAGKRDARLYCVDPFGTDENPEYQQRYYSPLLSAMDRTLEQAFSDHMRQSGLSSIAEAVRGYSFEIVQTWTIPIDFLFIDANHEYESVNRDFEQWEPFLKIGGIVALHDVSASWPGPTRVRDERFKLPKFDAYSQTDSLAWAIKIA